MEFLLGILEKQGINGALLIFLAMFWRDYIRRTDKAEVERENHAEKMTAIQVEAQTNLKAFEQRVFELLYEPLTNELRYRTVNKCDEKMWLCVADINGFSKRLELMQDKVLFLETKLFSAEKQLETLESFHRTPKGYITNGA